MGRRSRFAPRLSRRRSWQTFLECRAVESIIEGEELHRLSQAFCEYETRCELNRIAGPQRVAKKELLRLGDHRGGQLDHGNGRNLVPDRLDEVPQHQR